MNNALKARQDQAANALRNAAFHTSLKNHQLTPHNGFALPVMLLASDNPAMNYPIRGVLQVFEQGTDLGVSQAVFHERFSNGALGAPVVARNPKFIYLDRS